MNKKIVKSSLIALALAGGSVFATDFHAPLPGGPLRYDFEKIEKNKSIFNCWTTGYMREADKAYMKHGFNTHPLTALIFGKSEFTISEAFANATVGDSYWQNQNPNLSTVMVAPRVSYSERGMVLGASLAYPVWANKGRVGLRGSLPLRSVRMEKDDEMEHANIGDQRKAITGDMRYINPTDANLGGAGAAADLKPLTMANVSYYNLKYLSGIKGLDGAGKVVTLYSTDADGQNVKIGGKPYVAAGDKGTIGKTAKMIPMLILKGNADGTPPIGKGGGVLYDTRVAGAAPGTAAYANALTTDTRVAYMPADMSVAGNIVAGGAITLAPANAVGAGVAKVLSLDPVVSNKVADIPGDLWATTIHGANGTPVAESGEAKTTIDTALANYQQDVTAFLGKQVYVFQTYNLTGLGDADLDLFYSHNFSDRWNGEIYGGVKIPTGAGDKYYGNPYKMNLGNGDHFEIKVGGKIACATTKCLTIKADAHYNFVLDATEKRMAVFAGSTVKNIGPRADADVSWGYFTGNLDVTLYHPKTKDIATTIGYELYYKTEDRITFKDKSMAHFLGGAWVEPTATAVGEFVENKQLLGNKEARKGTEGIAHRGYVEGSYAFSKYLGMSVGGKYTFAGQNVPCEGEVFTGFNVKF